LKLSISNIIWTKGEEHLTSFLENSNSVGFSGVELALSCFWEEPTLSTKSQIQWLKEQLEKFQLEISALHSLTFTREDLELFGSSKKRFELLDYTKRYIDLANLLECRNIVFGSPKSRKTNGKSKLECDEIFLNFLKNIEEYSSNVFLNIEPLHPSSCEYLNTFDEVLSLVQNESFHNIKIQLDVRSFIENGESLEILDSNYEYISHCQVSDPGLKIPTFEFSKYHEKTHQILKEKKYAGFVAGEILNRESINEKVFLKNTFNILKHYYV
jgi:sugar phosphate isomerase/epimerase